MEFSSDNLERVVCEFYESDATFRAEAHEWLKEAKDSPEAWAFVWELLQPEKTYEVQFFAATTLHTKIKKCLNELTSENVMLLREKLMNTILAYATGPQIILQRLCISFSAYLRETCPEKWPDALPALLMTFTPENLPLIPAERTLWILLEILKTLPEDVSTHPSQHHKGLLRHYLHEHTPSVVALLEKILINHMDPNVISQAVTCASSWITIGVPLKQYQNLYNILINLVFNTHENYSGICETTLECLKSIVDQPENYKYPSYLLHFLTKIIPLKEIIARELTLGDIADQELISNIYNLFLAFGETHCRQCLNWIKEGGDPREQVMALFTSILECSGAKGYYPTDETYSRLAFGFWYILEDEIIMSSPPDQDLFLKQLGPIYKELVSLLIMKAELPGPDQNFSEDATESFRCYRQDISDTLMYCHNIFRQTTVELIQSKLEKINVNETRWQELEACLFSLCSISENVELQEENFFPSLFQYIRNLPFEKLDTTVFSTALDTIGAYADWISAHRSSLEHVVPVIILGLNVPEATSSATMALKDLAKVCQNGIGHYAIPILDASQEALHGGKLKLSDSLRLMCAVGILLSFLETDGLKHYMTRILTPYIDQLKSLAQQPPSLHVKNNTLVCLKMLSSATLNFKLPSEEEQTTKDTKNDPHPLLVIIMDLFNSVPMIANSWSADEYVMQALFTMVKHSMIALNSCACLVVREISDFIVSTCRVHPWPAALDLSKMLCILFGKEPNYADAMQSLSNELCAATIAKLSSAQNLSEHRDLLEALFTFFAQVVKKIPKLVAGGDPVSLFQCATISLAIPELPAVKAAASFLVNFISQGPGTESFTNVVNAYGQQLVHQLVSCVAGKASRPNIEPLVQVFRALNKNYYENYCRWLREVVTESVCPQTTSEQRASFISALIAERYRVSVQETVRKFSLICRGIIGTEYAQSQSAFI